MNRTNFFKHIDRGDPPYQSPPGQLSLVFIVPVKESRPQQQNISGVGESVISGRGSTRGFLWKTEIIRLISNKHKQCLY